MDKLARQFGQEVRTRRRAIGMTQATLAERTGMSEEWVRRIERGNGSPSFEALEAFATALGASVSDLFGSAPHKGQQRLQTLLSPLSDAELDWAEQLLRAAFKYPRA